MAKDKGKKKDKAKFTETTVFLALSKDTPGTYVYKQVDEEGNDKLTDDDGAFTPSIYIRRAGTNGKPPKFLTSTFKVWSGPEGEKDE